MDSTIKIDVVKHGDVIAETLPLFNSVLRSTASQEPFTLKEWSWRHLNNPFVKDQSDVTIARKDGRLVGANCFIVLEFMYRGKRMKAVQSCDTMVHPAFRRFGIFSQMIMTAENHFREQGYHFLFGFPNQYSLPGFLKAGWKQVRSMYRWDLLLNVEKTLQNLMPIVPLKRLASHSFKLFFRNAFNRSDNKLARIEFETSTNFPKTLSEISETLHPEKLELNRDKAYLEWKIFANKSMDFKYVFSMDDKGLIWYSLVARVDHKSGSKIGYIVDLRVGSGRPEGFLGAIYSSAKVLGRDGCDIVSLFDPEGDISRTRAIRSLGFRPFTRYYRVLRRQQHLAARLLLVKDLNCFTIPVDSYDPQIWDPTQIYFDGL